MDVPGTQADRCVYEEKRLVALRAEFKLTNEPRVRLLGKETSTVTSIYLGSLASAGRVYEGTGRRRVHAEKEARAASASGT